MLNTTHLRPYKAYSVRGILSLETEPPRKKFYTLRDGEDIIEIRENAINVVLCNDARRNVWLSSKMFMELSAGVGVNESGAPRDAMNVTYINSFASRRLLQHCLARNKRSAQQLYNIKHWEMAERFLRGDADFVKPPGSAMFVLDSGIGQWNYSNIALGLREHKMQVVILNSLEFAPLTPFEKNKIAQQLIELQRELNLTVIVFSQETRKQIKEGVMSSGAVGRLACIGTVSRCTGSFTLPFDEDSDPPSYEEVSGTLDANDRIGTLIRLAEQSGIESIDEYLQPEEKELLILHLMELKAAREGGGESMVEVPTAEVQKIEMANIELANLEQNLQSS